MAESVAIPTPEHVAFSVELADLGSRFLAIAVDSAIQGAILAATLLVLAALFFAVTFGGLSERATSLAGSIILGLAILALFVDVWGYHIAFETWRRGQTPGKRLFHIRVVKDNGSPVSFLDATIRNLVRVADMLPASYAIGVVAIVLSKDHKRLGDMAAGTLVIREGMTPRGVGLLDRMNGQDAGLDPRQGRVLAEFLDRAHELDPASRDRIARELADKLGYPGPEPFAALVALGRQLGEQP
jgi:uncharacterized RDD family membrane protein YckC